LYVHYFVALYAPLSYRAKLLLHLLALHRLHQPNWRVTSRLARKLLRRAASPWRYTITVNVSVSVNVIPPLVVV
jgi:hypothetical protein